MSDSQNGLPIGIIRLREQWKADGLLPDNQPAGEPRSDEYTLTEDQVLAILGISARELYDLVSRGEIDCHVPDPLAGPPTGGRMFSEKGIQRYLENCRRKASAFHTAAIVSQEAVNIPSSAEYLDPQELQEILLIELRNLKEQQRDLTSFVYQLAEKLSGAEKNGSEPKSKRKRKWYFFWLR